MNRRQLALAGVVSLLAAVAVAATMVSRLRGPGVAADGPADLVVLLATGLRADLGDPGIEPRAADAYLDALGRRPSIRFRAAYVQSTHPHASLGALLAGRYPSAIPLCGHRGKALLADDADALLWCSRIPADRHTLPELAAAYGYATRLQLAGASVGAWDGSTPELAVDGGRTPLRVSTQASLVDDVAVWWRENAERPRLLVVVDTAILDLQLEHVPRREPPVAQLYDAYLARARETGARHGALLDALDDGDRPRWIVASSLTGLNLAERSGSDDGYLDLLVQRTVAERTAHVPLALFGPGRGRREVTQPVELIDVAPTLLQLAGVPVPEGLPGEDLRALRGAGDPDAQAYVEFGDSLALRRGEHLLTFRYHWHNASSLDPALTRGLVESAGFGPGSENHYRLHDVLADPLQTTDVLLEQRALSEALQAALLELRQGVAAPPGGALEPSQADALRAFQHGGYW